MKYLLILLFICSCATAKKKAIELSEKGQHEEAISFWAEALKKDPDDEEIQNGFQSSLDFVSNDRLTRIRDKRLANNMQGAIEELKGLVDLQKKYNVKLDFNSSSFQGKEVQYTWPYYRSTILSKIEARLPLSAESDHKNYYHVYNTMKDYSTLQSNINVSGQKKCQELKSLKNKKPFFQSFVNQFCHYFKASTDTKSNVSSALYVKIKSDAQIFNLNDLNLGALEAKLNKKLIETPWHNSEAVNALPLELRGEYKWQHHTIQVPQSHNYKAKIPYTDYQPVTKQRRVTETKFINGIAMPDTRIENYTENEPVTKFREEPRFYNYMARKNSLTMTFSIKGNIRIENETYPVAFQKELKEERILHDYNLPEIGLYPKKDDVSHPMTKYESLSEELAEILKKDLMAIWEKRYCNLPSDHTLAAIGENVTRCQKLTNHPEEFVNSWFKNNFGVTGIRAQELLGHY